MIKNAIIILILLAFTPLTVGGVGHYPDNRSDYQIRFGWMKKKADGSYYVYKETKMIPLKLKETGFRWGYTIHSKNPHFKTHSIDYGPSTMPELAQQDPNQAQENILVKMDPTSVYDGVYWRWTANDPEDPIGSQKIEVFINGQLYKTIHFTITKP